MKAMRVHSFGEPPRIEEAPDPALRPGCVIVRVLAAFVPSPMKEFTQGQVPFPLPPLPYVPGADAVGVVERVADDVHGFEPGQKVYCDDWVTLKGKPEIGAYVGLAAPMPGAEPVLREWPNGCFAEKFILPAECFTPLGPAERVAPEVLCRLGYIGTGYGALMRGAFRPGHVVVVNGATGVLGVSTVLVALALGAARVVALGRKPHVLARLEALAPSRVATLSTVKGVTAQAIVAAAGEPAHLFVDAVGFTRDATPTLAAIDALGVNGFAVLMGGLDATVPVAYATMMIGRKLTIRGSEWFPSNATRELLRMIGSGVLDLGATSARAFPLDDGLAALDAAASSPGGFEHVAIVP